MECIEIQKGLTATERIEEIVIRDQQEAAHLFERDSSYLSVIGERYGIDVSGRGNLIRIKGEEGAVEKAVHVVEHLRHMVHEQIRLSERPSNGSRRPK